MTASSASPSSVFDLAYGDVHLWLCSLTTAMNMPRHVLSVEEQKRYQRRPDAAAARVWLRHQLSHYGPKSPAEWTFCRGKHGKPDLQGAEAQLQFNLSHSGDWIVLALSAQAAVGVDVQWHDPGRSVAPIARRYFQASEAQALLNDSGINRTEFYHYWSMKEAWAKARGAALPGALGSAGFALSGARLECTALHTPGESVWLMAIPGYSLALSTLTSPAKLRARMWHETGRFEPFSPTFTAATEGAQIAA